MCTSHEWTKYRHMYILIVPILWHASVSVSIVVESFACHVWVSTQPYVHVLYMILGISVYDVKPGFCQCPMDEPASMGLVRSRANHPKRFIGGHTRPQKKCSHPSRTTHGGWVSTKMWMNLHVLWLFQNVHGWSPTLASALISSLTSPSIP